MPSPTGFFKQRPALLEAKYLWDQAVAVAHERQRDYARLLPGAFWLQPGDIFERTTNGSIQARVVKVEVQTTLPVIGNHVVLVTFQRLSQAWTDETIQDPTPEQFKVVGHTDDPPIIFQEPVSDHAQV